jgi:predicted TIM-barrel fold metal-dependent hydrolase
MDRSGIEKSLICSIATKPSQFEPILKWSKSIRSERIIPLLSFHPADPDFREKIRIVKGEGFAGVKFHPYYQEFDIDEERMLGIYECLCRENLIVVMHNGFDLAFPRIRRADPAKVLKVCERFPGLKLVTTHLGSWEQWREVETLLAGKPIYMELSFSLEYLASEPIREIILKHPKEYILFGSDSPWTDQAKTLELFQGLKLGTAIERAILRDNAARLLASTSAFDVGHRVFSRSIDPPPIEQRPLQTV